MNWIDDTTAILSDKSILYFRNDGAVEFFGHTTWKKAWRNNKMKYDSKEHAIKIWTEVDNLLKENHLIK